MRAYYFGYVSSGHHLYEIGSRRSLYPGPDRNYTTAYGIPWPVLDGPLAPDNPMEVEGRALLHHKNGWTALSFADRSGDRRGGSHSTYLFDASLTFQEAVAVAAETFPEIFKRYPFTVAPL